MLDKELVEMQIQYNDSINLMLDHWRMPAPKLSRVQRVLWFMATRLRLPMRWALRYM